MEENFTAGLPCSAGGVACQPALAILFHSYTARANLQMNNSRRRGRRSDL